MSIRTYNLAALLLTLPITVSATGTDTLIASGQAVSFGGAAAGGLAESLDWIHRGANYELIGVGTTHEDFADTTLDSARVQGRLGVELSTYLAGLIEAGSGTAGRTPYTLTRETLDLSHTYSAQWQFTAGGQDVAADGARTVLLHAASVWSPQRWLSLRADLGRSIAGNLPTSFESLRASYVRRIELYAGISTGQAAESTIELDGLRQQSFTDAFAGIAVPLFHCMFGLSWDQTVLHRLIRRTAMLTVSVPLPQNL